MPYVARIPTERDGRRLVVLDDGRRFQVNAGAFPQLGLEEGIEVDETLLGRLHVLDARNRAREAALRLLRYRLRSQREVSQRLRRHGFSGEIIHEVITSLTHEGLLDDRRFALAWAEHRQSVSHAGPQRIRAELRAKGVSRSVVEESVVATFDANVEEETAAAVADRWMRRLSGTTPDVRFRRLSAVLHRRGFSPQTIVGILKRLAAQGIVDFPSSAQTSLSAMKRKHTRGSDGNVSDGG
jgi:regulatory protein